MRDRDTATPTGDDRLSRLGNDWAGDHNGAETRPVPVRNRARTPAFDAAISGAQHGRFPSLDERLLAMHLRGLSLANLNKSIRALEGIELPEAAIGARIEALSAKVAAWKTRPLNAAYAIVFFDSCQIKVRDGGPVSEKQMHFALGVRPDGSKDILDLWIVGDGEDIGWNEVAADFRNRGVADIYVLVHGAAQTIGWAFHEAFPACRIHRCEIQAMREALSHLPTRDKAQLTTLNARLWRTATLAEAREKFLALSDTGLGRAHPDAIAFWARELQGAETFFDLPCEIRQILCGASAVDALHAKLRRRGVRAPGCFLDDEAAKTLMILAIRNATADWHVDRKEWLAAWPQFARLFGETFTPRRDGVRIAG